MMAWIALLACVEQEPAYTPLPSVIDDARLRQVMAQLPACGAYRQDEDSFSFCVARGAHGLADTSVCAGAGAQTNACHLDWVSAKLRSPKMTRETLLTQCGPAKDCALMVLDAHPLDTLAAHADACDTYAGPFGNDCINHAGRAWAASKPSAQQIGALNELPNTRPDLVGFWVGVAQACTKMPIDCTLADGGTPLKGNGVACTKGYGQARERPGQWCTMQAED